MALAPPVREALLYLRDARLALERQMISQAQVDDAMRSAEHFMNCARKVLKTIKEE